MSRVLHAPRIRRATSAQPPRLHVFFCGTPAENRDYAILTDIAKHGGTNRWSGLKGACVGDRVLFYTVQDLCAFVASGWILEDTKETNDPNGYRYRTKIGAVRLLGSPVPIALIKQEFPAWGWSRYRRNITTVPEEISARLWTLVHRSGGAKPAPAPAEHGGNQTPRESGGGFGRADDNKLVEAAAIKAVTRHLTQQGYVVKSRESENFGYDLEARRGKDVVHAEVKGVSGGELNFIITQNEVATARIDPFFALFVVSRVRTKAPVISEFKGSDLDRVFTLTAISYSATKK